MEIPELTPGQQRLWKTLQFLLRLLALSVPLYLVIFLALDLSAMQLAAAGQSAALLQSLGWTVSQDGTLLTAGEFSFLINQDCTGWKSMLLLFALIFATLGISLRKRVLGLLVGIPLVWLGNLARILGTIYVQAGFGTGTALLVHDWLWQLGLVALVLAIWLAWLKFAGGFGYGSLLQKR
ncbi:MAG: exosortase/archaeosortase family protein [Candidatus Aenigmatarchaeota archaeon]